MIICRISTIEYVGGKSMGAKKIQKGKRQAQMAMLLVMEKGTAKYQPGKMQGAGIRQLEIDLNNPEQLKQQGAGAKRCFIIGTDAFKNTVSKIIRESGLKWNCQTRYKTEDEMMKAEHLSFPKAVEEQSKQPSKAAKKRTDLGAMFEKLQNAGLDGESAAGILLAADELEDYKIFPATPENLYRVFLRTASAYLQNEADAKKAVDIYLQVQAAEDAAPGRGHLTDF